MRCEFVLANEFKEGDLLVGGTRDPQVRSEARAAVAALTAGEITRTCFVDDQVTEALQRSLNSQLANEISRLTVAELKTLLLSSRGAVWLSHYSDGLPSEVIAAVAKVMTNEELSVVSRKLFNPLPGEGITIGSPSHFGSRIQPNSPGDDEEEILLSILEGLAYGCGDVILGLNPASDDVETIIRLEELLCSVVERLELPTRYCVLSDIVKQTSARERTRVDVGFQSLAGTSKAIAGMVGLDVEGLTELARGFEGLYFETGQGSAVTNEAAEGVDMVTLEARAYGVARSIRQQSGKWMIVNDVAGFIGPEVFSTGDQLVRACLEDTFMAKLHGLTVGLDVCATFHMGIAPDELKRLTAEVVEQAAPAYLMAVAGNSDPMLGYMTTSFREHPKLRRRVNKQIASAMHLRLAALGVINETGESTDQQASSLYAAYQKAGGDSRSIDELTRHAAKRIGTLQERGFDLGYGKPGETSDPGVATARNDAIYANARQALYATIEEAAIDAILPKRLGIRTRARDRNDYLAHPSSGEAIRREDAAIVRSLYPLKRPRIQMVVSDGLNANAVNENLRALVPPLRQLLSQSGNDLGDRDIMIENGRVRAGYHVGELLDSEVIIHLIGERPGTGLNTLSAYVTYGRDVEGQSRWGPGFDHSWTTAVCGIHPRGKPPSRAANELGRLVDRILKEKRSGVALGSPRSGQID